MKFILNESDNHSTGTDLLHGADIMLQRLDMDINSITRSFDSHYIREIAEEDPDYFKDVLDKLRVACNYVHSAYDAVMEAQQGYSAHQSKKRWDEIQKQTSPNTRKSSNSNVYDDIVKFGKSKGYDTSKD